MNPYREKAELARLKADQLNKPTAHDAAMRKAFPLGAGFGRKGAYKRIEATVNRAVKAVQAERLARHLEAMADRYDRGEVTAQGRGTNPERQERAAKAATYRATKADRIAAAQAEIEGRDPLTVDPETWATARGYLGGPGRAMVIHDHAERIAASKGKADVFGMLGDIFRP